MLNFGQQGDSIFAPVLVEIAESHLSQLQTNPPTCLNPQILAALFPS